MKHKKVFAVVGLAALVLTSVRPVWASSETDALINKLVEKKILTVEEAQEVRNEMAEDADKSAKARTTGTQEAAKAMPVGSWLNTVKWSGDLRLRHESQWREPAADRHRERFRLRFGFTAKPVDPLEIGVRLASGVSGDPLSTNQSFTNTFDKKTILIDRAYAKYTPWSWVQLIGGKMENPFDSVPEENVFDNDVTPEGAAVQLVGLTPIAGLKELLPVMPFANIGVFQLAELSGDGGDPSMFGFQAGADVHLPWGLTFRNSVAYYDMAGIKGLKTTNLGFTSLPGGNTTATEGSAAKFDTDFNMIDVLGKLTAPDVFGKPMALVGDFTYNPGAPDDDNKAWMVGTEIGQVTEAFGSWKAFYFFKQLEPDAVFAGLTDSDFGGGGTNRFGHIFGAQMGLSKYASVGLKYFRTDEIEGSQARNDTLQADVQLKY